AHCRYFPFHLSFGRQTEVIVNRSCRGVEPDESGNLALAFQEQLVAVAKPSAILEGQRLARKVHQRFERTAREAGVWSDVNEAARNWLATPGRLAEDAAAPAARRAASEPFAEEDILSRPFYLAPDLRWLTFESE